MAEPTAPTCIVTSVVVGSTIAEKLGIDSCLLPASYSTSPTHEYFLAPMAIELSLSHLTVGRRGVQVPKSCLPFGLVHGVVVLPAPPLGTKLVIQAHQELSAEFVGCVATLGADRMDGAHDHIRMVFEKTGHQMGWRMQPSASITQVRLEAPADSEGFPSSMRIVYIGANAVHVEHAKLALLP